MTRRRAVVAVLTAIVTSACGSSVRVPPTGSPPTIDPTFAPVDYPPPPAEVERVLPDPGEPCVWQDGYFTWSGRRWEWTPGKWVHAADTCYFVQPRLLYPETEGRQILLYAPPGWYRESAGAVSPCPPPNECHAR